MKTSKKTLERNISKLLRENYTKIYETAHRRWRLLAGTAEGRRSVKKRVKKTASIYFILNGTRF